MNQKNMKECDKMKSHISIKLHTICISSDNVRHPVTKTFVWRNSKIYKRKINSRQKLLARIVCAASHIKKREDQLRRTTRDLRTRVAKCTEVGGGMWGTFIVNCYRFVI